MRWPPMVEVPTDYRFLTDTGETDLIGLFAGRRQLMVYRFFYASDVENWPDGGCSGCSMFADNLTHHEHLAARDITFVFASAAPQQRIAVYKTRMGWSTSWVTLPDDRFSKDFDVEEKFGLNVFVRGRQETWQDVPSGRPQAEPYTWWRLHDHYGTASSSASR